MSGRWLGTNTQLIVLVRYGVHITEAYSRDTCACECGNCRAPDKCRFVTKYRHADGKLCVKVTDDSVCLQYRTEHAQDVKKLEKLTNQLMRHMASKEK